ncbi:MAG: DUF2341 domain-containing protein, partial [Verrucomicrobia bacterium]|nr:DUF2341 domain-containing protein [Verrucomicrobiota bacterium]
EQWDAAGGTASIWVRLPRIEGNSRQPLRMHWGKANASNAPDGKMVFNDYLSVWHMDDPVQDEVGTLESKDSGTTATAGVIGPARHFSGTAGISCGDKITAYPVADAPHTTELWFRAEKANVNLIGWGNEKGQGKVVMQFRGPPHIGMDCYFSEASIESTASLAFNEWNHVAFAYEKGNARVYVNGVLAGNSTGRGTPLNLTSPLGLWLGGWKGINSFTGDLDEVRISKVMRSADWIRLEYENQKPLQTLVGPLVRPSSEFAVTPGKAIVPEGGKASFTAQAGGALKLFWSLVQDGREEVVAVDRFSYELAAGRVTGDTRATLRLKAVFFNGVKTRDIPIMVKESVPDPEFTLQAPPDWDGSSPLEISPSITNLAALKAAGVGDVSMEWQAGPAAVTKDVLPDRLRLLATQKDGPLAVTATLSNGGTPVSHSVTVNVTRPAKPAWVERVPERDEKPVEGQFYARDERDEGTLHYNGTLEKPANEVFLKVFADDKPFANVKAKPAADRSYALSVKLKPGLVKYRVEFGTHNGPTETVIEKVGDLVCGDAFLIEGQSNALATDNAVPPDTETSPWIRAYGKTKGWGYATNKDARSELQLGVWGWILAKNLSAAHSMPICIINGAVGGTRIDQHQRNAANPADPNTIYGGFLSRLQQAHLTHGIRAIFWHQGESDQPGGNPMGKPGHEIYQPLFLDMADGWQRDLPNARHYYMFQIWPNSCAMGGDKGNGDRLREQQRTLPERFTNLSILSTLGIRPPGGCHYTLEGYNEFARMLQPLVERDFYGKKPEVPITSPNLRQVSFASSARDTLLLEFDQPVIWLDTLAGQFYLDGEPADISSGKVTGSVLTLKLNKPSNAKNITYLKETKWSQDTLLMGENGQAALTFCEVPISAGKVTSPRR